MIKDSEKLPRSYNKRFRRKVLDIACNKVGFIVAFFKNDFVEREIFHIRKRKG